MAYHKTTGELYSLLKDGGYYNAPVVLTIRNHTTNDTATISTNRQYSSMAFSNAGDLYLSHFVGDVLSVYKVNPTTGVVVATPIVTGTVDGGAGVFTTPISANGGSGTIDFDSDDNLWLILGRRIWVAYKTGSTWTTPTLYSTIPELVLQDVPPHLNIRRCIPQGYIRNNLVCIVAWDSSKPLGTFGSYPIKLIEFDIDSLVYRDCGIKFQFGGGGSYGTNMQDISYNPAIQVCQALKYNPATNTYFLPSDLNTPYTPTGTVTTGACTDPTPITP